MNFPESLKERCIKVIDACALPITSLGQLWLKMVGKPGIDNTPISRYLFGRTCISPIRNHYYNPLFNYSKHLDLSPNHPPQALTINHIGDSLRLIQKFYCSEELLALFKCPSKKDDNFDKIFLTGSALDSLVVERAAFHGNVIHPGIWTIKLSPHSIACCHCIRNNSEMYCRFHFFKKSGRRINVAAQIMTNTKIKSHVYFECPSP